jgi:hypothetical protein
LYAKQNSLRIPRTPGLSFTFTFTLICHLNGTVCLSDLSVMVTQSL